jgi:hypothetical protein
MRFTMVSTYSSNRMLHVSNWPGRCPFSRLLSARLQVAVAVGRRLSGVADTRGPLPGASFLWSGSLPGASFLWCGLLPGASFLWSRLLPGAFLRAVFTTFTYSLFPFRRIRNGP